MTLDGTNSADPDGGAIARYDWDFGDGTSALDAGSTPNHVYTATGNYTITLNVTDDEGETDSDTATASIGSGDLPPLADAGGPYTADIGETVTFDATGSSDPDGTIVQYDWEFGDGSFLVDGGATPSHSYSTAGTFNVILTVWDEVNLSDTDSAQATIVDPLDVPIEDGDDGDRDDDDGDREMTMIMTTMTMMTMIMTTMTMTMTTTMMTMIVMMTTMIVIDIEKAKLH